MSYHSEEGEMNPVLFAICRSCTSIMDGWVPIPSTCVAKMCGMTLYKARKEIKKLKEKGLVTSSRYVERGEERTYIINGYTITKAAKTTREYITAYSEERRICKEAFGIDIGEPAEAIDDGEI